MCYSFNPNVQVQPVPPSMFPQPNVPNYAQVAMMDPSMMALNAMALQPETERVARNQMEAMCLQSDNQLQYAKLQANQLGYNISQMANRQKQNQAADSHADRMQRIQRLRELQREARAAKEEGCLHVVIPELNEELKEYGWQCTDEGVLVKATS